MTIAPEASTGRGRAETMIPIIKPLMDELEVEAVRRVILSGWVTQGPEVRAFEEEFAVAVGATHACAVSSCTTALHLALRGVGVGPGDEVVTVSHSFVATANAVRYCGATPVFVDIDPSTYNMNPELIEPAISHRTKAILCVHQIGMPCDLSAILSIARGHNLPVVEDAACAIGSEIQWNGEWHRVGRPHGDVACFSFHPRKIVTTGDGGMLTTARADLNSKFRLWRQHSMSVEDTTRHTAGSVIFEEYPELGFNYRMTDIQAAVGRVQLGRLAEIVSRRRALAEQYLNCLSGVPGLGLPKEPVWAHSNWQSFCVRLPEGVDQRTAMQRMLEDGVSTRRGIMCTHREPAYRREPWRCGAGCEQEPARSNCKHLNQGEHAQEHAILLPLFHQMTEAEQDLVVESLRRAVAT